MCNCAKTSRCRVPAGERADRFTLAVEEGLTLPAVRERQRQIDAAADALLDGMEGLPAPEAAVLAHDALLRRVSYEEGAQDGDAGNLYGGLVRCGGVCGAYSRAYQYLMQRLGVPCAFLSGTSVRGIPHAWNAVKLEDGWYYVDATWDDLPDETGYLYHDYLLVTLEEISLEHFPEPGQYRELPPGDSDRYSYYRQFGYCADLGDPDPVAAMAAGFPPARGSAASGGQAARLPRNQALRGVRGVYPLAGYLPQGHLPVAACGFRSAGGGKHPGGNRHDRLHRI